MTKTASETGVASARAEALARSFIAGDPRLSAKAEPPDLRRIPSHNPSTGEALAWVRLDSKVEYDAAVRRAVAAQRAWSLLPAPRRGEVVRLIGNAFREHKEALGTLITLEVGKIRAEGEGEVQECIDIADFAVGLSRQLHGLTMHSERPLHRMYEQWHPLGTIGIITAFNFPVAVWAWNAMLAAACGDAMVWKPSLLAPLCSIAATRIVHNVMREQDIFRPDAGVDPCDLFTLVIGTDEEVGEALIHDPRLPLISATGSCRMGRHVGQVVASRFGRTLLELGGNNAIIVMSDADMDLVTRGVLFGAVGTAGQRCTTTRRLLCHHDIVNDLTQRLVKAYATIPIGDPLAPGTLMGPLINARAVEQMHQALQQARAEGCEILCGERAGAADGPARADDLPRGFFVQPTIVRVPRGAQPKIVMEETFAPILYIQEFDSLDQAITMQNSVRQGLSSAIFTDSLRSAETFLSARGSDCGIANVNIGTSGAEIGGAFGGEKETGGGRESGSDAWRQYMRRQTCTINFGTDLPLAQGIRFGE